MLWIFRRAISLVDLFFSTHIQPLNNALDEWLDNLSGRIYVNSIDEVKVLTIDSLLDINSLTHATTPHDTGAVAVAR